MKGKRIMYEFNTNTIKNFNEFESRRAIGRITGLINDWENEWDVINPLIVKPTKDKYTIIDGHHRLQSLREFLAKNPNRKVNGELYVFNPLSSEEAIDIYLHLDSTTRKQSTSDVLQVSSPLARIYDYIYKDFPIKVSFYNSEDSLMFARLFKTYFVREKDKAQELNKDTLVKEVISADMKDYYNLKEFFEMMKDVFGVYNRKNEYYSVSCLYFLNKVWFQNKDLLGESKLKSLLRKNLKGDYYFKEKFSQKRNRNEIDSEFKDLLLTLNKGNRGNKIIIASFNPLGVVE